MGESSSVFVYPRDELHKRVMRYYRPFLNRELIKLFIQIGCLVLGYAMLFIVYTFASDVHWVIGVAAYLLILVPIVVRFVRYIQLLFYTNFAFMIIMIIDFILTGIVLVIPLAQPPLLVTQISLAAGLLINAALTVYSYMDSLALCIRLPKRRYSVAEGVVVEKNIQTAGSSRYHAKVYSVSVKTSNDRTITVESILRRQYKECSVASSVLLVIPEPVESQLNSAMRIAVEPF